MEVFNDGHLNEVHSLLERRGLADPTYATLIFDGGTLTRPRPQNLLNAISNLPDGALFNTLAFGRHQLPFTTMGIPDDAREAAAAIGDGATAHEMKATGHFPMSKRPELFRAYLKPVLDDIRGVRDEPVPETFAPEDFDIEANK